VALIEKYAPLISLPPFQRCGTHHVCMAHIQYAPLIGGLSVAHIVYAPRIAGQWGPSGAHILSMAHISQYAPLTCKISMAHFLYAPRIIHDILSTTLLVGPTWVLVEHSFQHAPLVVKLSVKHILKCATSKY
jgi:hypothetical protein